MTTVEYEYVTEEHTAVPYDVHNNLISIKDDEENPPYHIAGECKCGFARTTNNLNVFTKNGEYVSGPPEDWKPEYSVLYPIPVVEKLGPIPVWYEEC